MEPMISVIVPVYNMEDYLDKCVNSIINQTYTNLEIILVDDGSTDKSPEKCDLYARLDPRVRVIHKLNGGLSSARNAGIDICRGEYIGFVDSDDWISHSMYEELMSICKDDKTIATIGIKNVTKDDKIVGEKSFLDSTVSSEEFLRNLICRVDNGSVCTRLFPRALIGNYRFNEKRLNEDVLFLSYMTIKEFSVVYSSSFGYYYFQRAGSTSRFFGKAIRDMVKNATEIRRYVDDNFPSLSKAAQGFEIFQYMSFLLCCPSNMDRKKESLYWEVLSYIRRNVYAGIVNPHMTKKEKFKLIGVSLFPKLMSVLLEKKIKVMSMYEQSF